MMHQIIFRFASLFLLIPFIASASKCDELIEKISFHRLTHLAEKRVESGTVEIPAWFKRSLPEGVSFVAKPGREFAPGRVQKELGPDFVVVRASFEFKGKNYETNVGISPEALVDNLFRDSEGKELSLVPERSRAAGVFIHGGGTELSSWANGGNAATQLSKRLISVISLDFFGHGVNRPDSYPIAPKDYVEFIPWFLNRYAGDEKPLFVMGHSMGGQMADLVQTRLSPSEIDDLYPGLPLKAVLMLSPPTDPTGGASLHTKVTLDNEYTDRDAQVSLFHNNNINLRSQEPLTDLAWLQTWNQQMLERPMLPGFAAMGVKDDVCYMGCEEVYRRYMEARKDVESILYTRVVDHNGQEVSPDHMIPKFFLPGQEKSEGIGKTMPIVFADALQFIERRVLDNQDFETRSSEAQNLQFEKTNENQQVQELIAREKANGVELSPEKARKIVQNLNTRKAYVGGLSKVFSLYAKNLLFREFVQNFRYKKRSTKSVSLSKKLTTFLSDFEAFNTMIQKYAKRLKNDKIPFENLELWQKISNELLTPKSQEDAKELHIRLVASDHPAERFAAAIIGQKYRLGSRDRDYGSFPDEFPLDLRRITDETREITDLDKLVAKLKKDKTILLGYRDLDLASLSLHYPELKQLKDKESKLHKERNEFSIKRTRLLGELVALHAQKTQMAKLFDGDIEKLSEVGNTIYSKLDELKSLDESLGAEAAIVEFKRLQDLGWQETAFESQMGPNLRNLYSAMDKNIKEYEGATKDNKKAKALKKVEQTWSAFVREQKQFVDTIDVNGSEFRFSDATLVPLKKKLETIESKALDILEEFFTLRESFIKENNDSWNENTRPQYPQRYYDLIDQYEAAQKEYQNAQKAFNQEQLELAVSGQLGPYLQYLYKQSFDIDHRIDAITYGKGLKEGELSLDDVEAKIIDSEQQMAQIEEQIIRDYASSLYRTDVVSAWDSLNDLSRMPGTEVIQKVLDAWGHIWRDPTGGQAQDSSAY